MLNRNICLLVEKQHKTFIKTKLFLPGVKLRNWVIMLQAVMRLWQPLAHFLLVPVSQLGEEWDTPTCASGRAHIFGFSNLSWSLFINLRCWGLILTTSPTIWSYRKIYVCSIHTSDHFWYPIFPQVLKGIIVHFWKL